MAEEDKGVLQPVVNSTDLDILNQCGIRLTQGGFSRLIAQGGALNKGFIRSSLKEINFIVASEYMNPFDQIR